MWKFRVHLALALCAGAGVCGLLAWHWDALRTGLVGALALWFGAGAFLWKASQALLGKIGLPQEQPPAQPVVPHPPSGAPGTPPWPPQPHAGPSPLPVVPSSATRGAGTSGADGEALTRAMGDAFGGTARTVWRAWIVLALVLLVPLTLGLAIGGIVSLYRGDLPQGGIMLGTAGFFTWYCCGPLRGRWQTEATALVDDGTGE